MADFTPTAQAGQTLQAEEDARKFERFISMEGRWVNGYGITTASDSHDVTIDPGEAFVGDDKLKLVGDVQGAHGDADTSVVKTLTNVGSAGDTFHIYLRIDGNLEINTSGVAPDDSIKLWTVTTDTNGVTGTTDDRTALVNIAADVEGKNVTARRQLAGETGKLDKSSDPEWVWTDGSTTFKVRLDSVTGKLQVLDGADAVQTDDLSDISNPVDVTSTDTTKDKTVSNVLAKGWEDHKGASTPHSGHEDTANKGAASGYAGLDSNTEVAQPAKSVALADRTAGAGTVWVDDTADDFKFRHSTGVETAERTSRKGAASGYAGLDGSQRVNQSVKLVRTTAPASATAGDIWVTTSDLNFRDGGAVQHTVAKDADLQAHIGDTGTDAHGIATTGMGGEAGFISSADQSKLDGVEAGAEVNQNAFDRVRGDGGFIATADQEGDLLDIDGGTHISTSVSGDVLTVTHDDAGLDGAPAVNATAGGVVISRLDATNGHIDGAQTKDLDTRYIQTWTFEEGDGESVAISQGERAIIAGGSGINTELTALSPATIEVNHDDTSAQGNVNTSGVGVIDSISLDTFGHVTGITARTLAGITFQEGDGENSVVDLGETFEIQGGSFINTELVSTVPVTIEVRHDDTSTQGNVSAATGAAITSANLDGAGHVTGLGTTDFDSRFVNEGQNNSIDSSMMQSGVRVGVLSGTTLNNGEFTGTDQIIGVGQSRSSQLVSVGNTFSNENTVNSTPMTRSGTIRSWKLHIGAAGSSIQSGDSADMEVARLKEDVNGNVAYDTLIGPVTVGPSDPGSTFTPSGSASVSAGDLIVIRMSAESGSVTIEASWAIEFET